MIRIQVLRNTELNSLLLDAEFIANWQNLANHTLGFHVLQEPAFVLTWYKHYQLQYEPVLLLAIDEKEDLIGLMALAWDEENQVLTHGGHTAAEYHGWLALPRYSDGFFVQSLLAIKKHFPLKKWEWNFMPPHLPFSLNPEEEKQLKKAGVFLAYQEEESPLWDLRDEAKLKKTCKSSSLRSKRNRLKKRGELRFEIIEEGARARETLEIAAKQCDFRKEAQHNTRPYEEDLRKLPFDVDLIGQGTCLHCCALWLDDQLLAFHIGASDGKTVHLGMISFDPSEYAASPGAILFAELAKSLTEAGYETFDITPGGDGYKQRYSNSSVQIKKPTVYFSRSEFEKGKFQAKIKSYLHSKGLLERTKELRFVLKENPLGLINYKAVFSLENSRKVQVYQINPQRYEHYSWQRLGIAQQNYEDLLLYQDTCPYRNRRQLLIDAYEKFKKTERLYSVKSAQELEAFGWKRTLRKETWIAGELLEPGSVILYDFYFKIPELKKVTFQAIIQTMLSDVLADQSVYVLLEKSEISLLAQSSHQAKAALKPV